MLRTKFDPVVRARRHSTPESMNVDVPIALSAVHSAHRARSFSSPPGESPRFVAGYSRFSPILSRTESSSYGSQCESMSAKHGHICTSRSYASLASSSRSNQRER